MNKIYNGESLEKVYFDTDEIEIGERLRVFDADERGDDVVISEDDYQLICEQAGDDEHNTIFLKDVVADK